MGRTNLQYDFESFVTPVDENVISRFGVKLFDPELVSYEIRIKVQRLEALARRYLTKKELLLYYFYFVKQKPQQSIAKYFKKTQVAVNYDLRKIRRKLLLYYEYFYTYKLHRDMAVLPKEERENLIQVILLSKGKICETIQEQE